MPVEDGNSIVNQICRRLEEEFNGIVSKISARSDFDYSMMKSGCEYSTAQYRALVKLFRSYQARVKVFVQCSKKTRIARQENSEAYRIMTDYFRAESEKICPDSRARCDMLLDICYRSAGTKQFVWDMCAGQIIENLLCRSGRYHLPVPDEAGEIECRGRHFRQAAIEAGGLECTV